MASVSQLKLRFLLGNGSPIGLEGGGRERGGRRTGRFGVARSCSCVRLGTPGREGTVPAWQSLGSHGRAALLCPWRALQRAAHPHTQGAWQMLTP